MEKIREITIEEKKSKFIGYYYKVDSKEEADEVLKTLRKEHKKARHIPYAYKIDQIVKKSDDKEPANTAGTPIYNLLEKRELNHALIAVVRYFGGIKLGAGGLYRAYLKAASEAIEKRM